MTMIATPIVGQCGYNMAMYTILYSYRYSSIISKLPVYFWHAVTTNDLVCFINWIQFTGRAIDCTTLSLYKSI